jgi:acyl carrier protein
MFDQIRDIIARKFQVDPDDITPESTLKDLELDSLDVVDLSLVVEKELGVAISDDEMLQAETVAAVVTLVESRNTRV